MPTGKQRKAFDKIIENPHKPVSEVMLEVGYDPNTAIHPKDLTESKGFIQLLNEHGLDDESLARRHKDLLDNEPTIAIKALDLAYKVKGSYAPDKSINLNANVSVTNSEELKELAKKMSNEIKQSYAQGDISS